MKINVIADSTTTEMHGFLGKAPSFPGGWGGSNARANQDYDL